MSVSVLWFRRDLRLDDHPALGAAAAAAEEVLPVFVLDDLLRRSSGAARLAFLYRSLRALEEVTDGRLVVLRSRPTTVIPRLAAEMGAEEVHVSADFGPYGRRRDAAVEAALTADGRTLLRTGSPYAVSPGRLFTAEGTPFRVYSAYRRAWLRHGWHPPAPVPAGLRFAAGPAGDPIPADPDLGGSAIPAAGEAAATRAWDLFREQALGGYAERRNSPGLPGTSRLSVYLKYGALHPRTLLAGLGDGAGAAAYRGELAWREFYADVLFHRPQSSSRPLQPAMDLMRVDTGPAADGRFAAWAAGRTGYPIVDAGMRQLAAEAWMHNRVRMITASFLVKDLHIDWTRGARLFLDRLVDGDLASNAHGWQWVAGTGTDPAPYFRIFNPVTQGKKFDPAGDYIRRYVPELRDVPAPAVHEPWTLPAGPPAGYPAPVVDHRAERAESLERYAATRGSAPAR